MDVVVRDTHSPNRGPIDDAEARVALRNVEADDVDVVGMVLPANLSAGCLNAGSSFDVRHETDPVRSGAADPADHRLGVIA